MILLVLVQLCSSIICTFSLGCWRRRWRRSWSWKIFWFL